jgi:hypothetical protein
MPSTVALMCSAPGGRKPIIGRSTASFFALAGALHSGANVGPGVAYEPADEKSGAPGGHVGSDIRRPVPNRLTDLLTILVESGRRESNPHDQLGELLAYSGRRLQSVPVSRRYAISAPLRCRFG